MDILLRIKRRNFAETVGKRLWVLGDLERQPDEVRKHYLKIGQKRTGEWVKGNGGLTQEMADILAFSIHSEAENSWAEMKKEMDNPVVLSQDKDTEYLDAKLEEQDYIAWLKKKGYLPDES